LRSDFTPNSGRRQSNKNLIGFWGQASISFFSVPKILALALAYSRDTIWQVLVRIWIGSEWGGEEEDVARIVVGMRHGLKGDFNTGFRDICGNILRICSAYAVKGINIGIVLCSGT
jgi:hypothetical protein